MQPSPLRQSLQLVWMSPYPLLPIHMLDDAPVAVWLAVYSIKLSVILGPTLHSSK